MGLGEGRATGERRRASRGAARPLAAALTIAVTVALSIVVVDRAAPAQTTEPPPDTTPDTTPTTTTTTTPPDTTPTTTTTTTPPTTTPDTTPTTTTTTPDTTVTTPPDTTDTTPAASDPDPAPDATEPEDPPRARDTDVYVGSVSTLNPAQRAAIDEFLAATARLARAQTVRAGIGALSTMNDAAPGTAGAAEEEPRAPTRIALLDSAVAVNRAVMRVAFFAQEAFGARASEAMDAAARAAAQAEVDAAQAELDRAVEALRAVARGDPLITALLTGKPPAGDTIGHRIALAQAGQGNPAALTELFDVPVPHALLVSRYGFRVDPFTGDVRFHPGVDISAPQGTPIRAVAAGTVILSGGEGGYGTTVVLDHGDSLATLYGHMVRVAVGRGEHVATGDVIGYVGSTGRSTGPHLHFEVRIHGVPVDPLPTFKS